MLIGILFASYWLFIKIPADRRDYLVECVSGRFKNLAQDIYKNSIKDCVAKNIDNTDALKACWKEFTNHDYDYKIFSECKTQSEQI